MLRLLTFTFIVSLCLSSLCTNLTLGYYTYDLSHLEKIAPLQDYTFNLCQNILCKEVTGYLYSTHIAKSNLGCVALTRNYGYIQPVSIFPK